MSGAIPSWVKKGVQCVLVDTSCDPTRILRNPFPPKGEPLTITGVRTDPWDGAWCVTIEGHPNPMWALPVADGGWRVSRFRPLITQQDDISTHFARYLNTDHRERV